MRIKVVSREVKTLTEITYNNGCTKTIQRIVNYTDSSSQPVFRYKSVDFRLPDNTTDETRSYSTRDTYEDHLSNGDSYSESEYGSDSDSETEVPKTEVPETESESDSESDSDSDSESVLNKRLKLLLSRLKKTR